MGSPRTNSALSSIIASRTDVSLDNHRYSDEFWFDAQADRDACKARGEELEGEVEASKGRERETAAELCDTQRRLEVGGRGLLLLLPLLLPCRAVVCR